MPWPSDSETVTLTAATVATVTLDQDYDEVTITNHSSTDYVNYLVDSGATDPATDGAGTGVVLAGERVTVPSPGGGGSATQVKVVSAGTPKVTVEAGGR